MFDKIEDEVIKVQLDKLANSKKLNEAKEAGIPAEKEEVSYDDFSKMDIRVARILAAEKVPKTDKLIKLELDTGIDKRTVVSGISEYFKPDEIIGKQVCILANLAPRKLRGIVSHGMVLLAEDTQGKLIFVTPEEVTGEGSVVL